LLAVTSPEGAFLLAAHLASPSPLILQPPGMFSHTALLGLRRMALSEIKDDDDEIVVALSAHSIRLHWTAAVSRLVRCLRTGGSCHGRRQLKPHDFCSGVYNIMRAYFRVHEMPPLNSAADFERRFRMPRALFQSIYDDAKNELFFQQHINATRQLQTHPHQNIFGALRVLAYGEATDRAETYVRFSGSTIRQAVGHLTRFIVQR